VAVRLISNRLSVAAETVDFDAGKPAEMLAVNEAAFNDCSMYRSHVVRRYRDCGSPADGEIIWLPHAGY
jgi:hypothetical protein